MKVEGKRRYVEWFQIGEWIYLLRVQLFLVRGRPWKRMGEWRIENWGIEQPFEFVQQVDVAEGVQLFMVRGRPRPPL